MTIIPLYSEISNNTRGGYKRGMGGEGWKFSKEIIYMSKVIFDPRKATSSFVSKFKPYQFNFKIDSMQLQNIYFSRCFWKFSETEN